MYNDYAKNSYFANLSPEFYNETASFNREMQFFENYLGGVLNNLISFKKLEAAQVAFIIDISLCDYYDYLFSVKHIPIIVLLKLCRLLKVDLSVLISLFDIYKKTKFARMMLDSFSHFTYREFREIHDNAFNWFKKRRKKVLQNCFDKHDLS